jgi:RNA polymerase sigma-70 factor (ECF subfamily)
VQRDSLVPAGASRVVRGSRAVAGQALAYSRLGLVVRTALVNGAAGVVSFRDGQPFAVLAFTVTGGKVVEIDILADPARLRQLALTTIAAEGPERNERTGRN